MREGYLDASALKRVVVVVFLASSVAAQADTAIFAGGCFWCVEAAFQEVPGVTDAVSGFTGGRLKNPTYNGNHRGHWEVVEITYDPEKISYRELLDIFWVNVDPFDDRGQFCDKGPSYRSAIFVGNDNERELASASKQKVMAQFSGLKVVTEIRNPTTFYPVEEYHQDYWLKNPIRYRLYRAGCRRDARLEEIWGTQAGH